MRVTHKIGSGWPSPLVVVGRWELTLDRAPGGGTGMPRCDRTDHA